ncbi:Retrovirus-related Pol polyprotein from transposon 297 [Araneus ventricosus]|uniref:Retrovirus-related Pol polyprotein from transposon 297 n=1 Tax=Araneus ventricosus TaxID=182803 RepID=A0A4Y2HR71_ARAVE|nr:Retrovirus-related Pol polyprotein from transposon 297 [Araneus ventricosus]
MTFVLRNAAQSFQRFMDQVSRDLDCFACLDDILVASKDLEKHKVDLEKVFQRLKDYHLKINLEICEFGEEKIQFLGFHESPGGVSPLPDRLKALTEYPFPKSVEELDSLFEDDENDAVDPVFPCTLYGETFALPSSLKNHKRLRHGNKRQRCDPSPQPGPYSLQSGSGATRKRQRRDATP